VPKYNSMETITDEPEGGLVEELPPPEAAPEAVA
jgi:hypothetical protein